jgi:cell division protein FtsB
VATRPGSRPQRGRPATGRGRGTAARRGEDQRSSRPAARRPQAGRPTITVRGSIIAVLGVMAVLALTVPLKAYVTQRSEISTQAQANAATRARIAALHTQAQNLQDPEYVKQQARTRLHYGLPGENAAIVIAPPLPSVAPQHVDGRVTVAATSKQPWWERLWGSTVAAGRTPAAEPGGGPTPAPAATPSGAAR